jgi:diadenylate cyclase
VERLYEQKRFQQDVKLMLSTIQEKTNSIQETISEEDCCILSEFDLLLKLVSDAQSVASSYYLESYLSPYTTEYNQIAKASSKLSEKRHGALIVVERKQPLVDILHNGVLIGAKFSQTLLETIFYPGNPLHDGAVLIQNDFIHSAGNILPVSNQTFQSKKLGTRHRAALGLSEMTDAIMIVVSEETGRITFAINGNLHVVKT